MSHGDVVLIRLALTGSVGSKLRPALVLASLPGSYQNTLICGMSTQFHQLEPNWDEVMQPSDPDFAGSGLHQKSAIRLSYLFAATTSEIVGTIGRIDAPRLARLRPRLASRLRP